MKSRIRNKIKELSLEVLVVISLFLLSLGVFAFIANEVFYEHEDAFDKSVQTIVARYSSPALIEMMMGFTFFGSSGFLLPAYILLVGYFLIKKNYRNALFISILVLSSTGLMFGLKLLFQRQRPQFPIIKGITSYSFPSGHTLSAAIFCSILGYLVWDSQIRNIWKGLLIFLLLLLALTVGFSRIALNVHFATDVIAGFCLGVMWMILSFWVMKRWKSVTLRRPGASR